MSEAVNFKTTDEVMRYLVQTYNELDTLTVKQANARVATARAALRRLKRSRQPATDETVRR